MSSSNLKKLGFLSGCAVAIVALIVATRGATAQAPPVTLPGYPIGAARVVFTTAQLTSNRFAVRAFVPTGSLHDNCLGTLAESNFAVPGISLFCAPRTFNGQNGILVSAFFSQPIPEELTDFLLAVTVYQEGARQYGPPIFFPD